MVPESDFIMGSAEDETSREGVPDKYAKRERLGLVPRQHSSGGKDRLGRVSKRGDGYIGRLLVHGARTVLHRRRAKPGLHPGWTDQLLARRPTNVVLVAMAN